MSVGGKFEVLLEGGTALLVEIVEETRRSSVARVLETRSVAPLPRPHVHLVLSMPRLPVFEAVIEKATELGVAAVHPVFSDHSFIRAADDALEKKRPRWEKIVLGATQQCGRGELMGLFPAERLDVVASTFNRSGGAVGLFVYEAAGGRDAKSGLAPAKGADLRQVWLFVGSEGGFSGREAEMFRGLGMQPITLGPQVLRVETACVALVAILKYELDQMR